MLNKKNLGVKIAMLLCVSSLMSACGTMSGNSALVVDGQSHKVINARAYTVQKGDTLYSISFAANKDYREVAAINHMRAPYRIHAGDQIVLSTHVRIKLPAPNAHERAQIELLEPKILTHHKIHKKPFKTKKSVTIAKHKIKKRPQVKKNTKVFHSVTDNIHRRRNVKHYAAHKKVKRNLTKVVSRKPVNHWLWPAKGKVVGTFSLQRVGNRGLDISGKYGSPVRASAPGTVVYSGSGLRGYGNLVIIKHNAYYLSAYAYNNKLLVREGTKVKAGQRIATMGRTDTGKVKLHFEIRRVGKPVDPKIYLS